MLSFLLYLLKHSILSKLNISQLITGLNPDRNCCLLKTCFLYFLISILSFDIIMLYFFSLMRHVSCSLIFSKIFLKYDSVINKINKIKFLLNINWIIELIFARSEIFYNCQNFWGPGLEKFCSSKPLPNITW